MRWPVLVACGPLFLIAAAVPRFDPTALLRGVLVPADAAVDSVIYRLRASDSAFDYPLIFSVEGQLSVVSIQNLNCTRFNSVCQSNVVLKRRLEAGRIYDFLVVVRNRYEGRSVSVLRSRSILTFQGGTSSRDRSAASGRRTRPLPSRTSSPGRRPYSRWRKTRPGTPSSGRCSRGETRRGRGRCSWSCSVRPSSASTRGS